MDALTDVRPTWRGWIHRVATPAMAVAFFILYRDAQRVGYPGDTTAVAVYAAGVLSMFGISAAYHASAVRPSRLSRVLQRLDHGAILLAIAGTYTAVTHMAVREAPAHFRLLAAIWILTTIGIVVQVLLVTAPRWVGAVGYLLVGWFAVFDIPGYLRGTTTEQFAWIVAGGLLYTAGAVIYALKRPNPVPAHFGFHEIFHSLTVVAALAHYVAVTLLLHAPNVA